MKSLPLFALAALLSVPASAQTTPIVVYMSAPDRAPAAAASSRTTEQRIVNVAQVACDRPSLRSLKGQQLYRACVADVSADLAARQQSGAATVVASR
ncbi:MAG: hypothetical protein ABIT10_01150 [Alteraurantiacibacter sp.]